MKSIDKFVLVLVASLALLLAGCGGGSSTTTPPAPPPPSAYEMALGAINAATTPEDAQAAYDAVKDDVTAAEGEQLQMAVDSRQAALAMMARADAQKMALINAAGMVDTSDLSTQEAVDAAREAIVGLRQAIADAVDVADTSMYQSMLDNAIAAVDEAQGGIDTATRRTNQMDALSDASGMLQAALAALSGSTPTQAQLDAANNAVTALNAAIAAGADLTDAEKATYVREAANAAAPISTAQMAFDDAEGEAQRKADMEMAAMAAKLWTGLGATPLANNGVSTAIAAGDGTLTVQRGTTTATPLEENEDTTVASLHGWEGSEHTATVETASADNIGTYTAQVYSNVGDPTPGLKFGAAAGTPGAQIGDGTTAGDTHRYTLVSGRLNAANGLVLADAMSDTDFPSIGFETFTLTANGEGVQLTDALQLEKSYMGTYGGVEGDYYCTGAADATCTVTKTNTGFLLSGSGTWTFEPTRSDDRLMEMPDDMYAVYGWWLHEATDGTATVSAFTGERGTVTAAALAVSNNLNGSATYRGGAAGKYTIRAGATNDSGHFTADAELKATFSTDSTASTISHKVEGTINNFMGSDGMSRDWSVALGESSISGTGAIAGDPDDSTDTGAQETTWTRGGSAASTDGEWSGTLYDNNSGGVPQVGTGTFHSTYGNIGRMVGAFGVNLEN